MPMSMSNAEMLINMFMTSRLDYCNYLGGCSACLINKLQMVQNAAARVLTRTRNYDHISPVLSTLLQSQNSGHLIIPGISDLTDGGRSFFYLAPTL